MATWWTGRKLQEAQVVRQVIAPAGSTLRSFTPQLICNLPAAPAALRRCAKRPGPSWRITSSTCRSSSQASSARPSSASAMQRAACRTIRGSSGSYQRSAQRHFREIRIGSAGAGLRRRLPTTTRRGDRDVLPSAPHRKQPTTTHCRNCSIAATSSAATEDSGSTETMTGMDRF